MSDAFDTKSRAIEVLRDDLAQMQCRAEDAEQLNRKLGERSENDNALSWRPRDE